MLSSNHPETIMKYFVTNLNKHKHGIRAGISFIDTGIQRALHRQKAKNSDEQTLKESIYIIIIIFIIIYIIIKKIQQ